MSAWHDDGDEYQDFEVEDEPYIALDYAADEPNPLGEEGVTDCWLIIDGEPVPGVVITRKRTYVERQSDWYGHGTPREQEMELYFIPETGPE